MKYDEFKREGIEEGRAVGIAIGEKRGIQQKAIETAKKILKMNFPLE